MSHSTARKRHREQSQRERRLEKETRRLQRKTETSVLPQSSGQEDPDLAGMVAGPQRPREE
ncbi:MAG: hypothetical protein OJF52_000472 [Nitrospira sp.]|jgi:hypothetical protein|nr:MAG: hypothetical protein OJF52_000472 [Nitrospira sp.]